MGSIEILKEIIDKSNNIVVITGAGVSTQSGIPDFRSKENLENIKKFGVSSIEEILSKDYFMFETEKFYKFYRNTLLRTDVKPSITHKKLAKLEELGKIKAVITQNTDRLHQKAGSKTVIELHGNIETNICIDCNKKFSAKYIEDNELVPKCDRCGGLIKPFVTLYGEKLPYGVFDNAIRFIKNAEYLIVLGTTLRVYPAASLLDYFSMDRDENGKRKVVLMNRDIPEKETDAQLIFSGDMNNVWKRIKL